MSAVLPAVSVTEALTDRVASLNREEHSGVRCASAPSSC